MKSRIPSATISRLPVYLRSLRELPQKQEVCSSEEIAAVAGVNSAQVRKDLSYLGAHGVRGVGYDIESLRAEIRQALGLTKTYGIAIVGAGNLGTALSRYAGFSSWGFRVGAIFDVDTDKIGMEINDLTVEPLSDLERIVSERSIAIGVIATPAGSAQDVAERLSAAGIRSILNFAPAVLQVPGVEVRRVDLSTELQILSFHLQREDRLGPVDLG